MPIDPKTASSFLQNLPAIFTEDPFLGRFLLAFEQVLTGLPGVAGREPEPPLGLEEIIAAISKLFDPKETREDFLPWLAGWVALGLRADWTERQKRDFLANIVPLYRRRGTKENLAELLRIYTGLSPVITGVAETDFQIGVHSTIGEDAQIGGSAPHFFHVSVTMPNPDPATLVRQRQIATALIELQKPAHTDYELDIVFDTMQIGLRSTIGVDTLLGSLPPPPTSRGEQRMAIKRLHYFDHQFLVEADFTDEQKYHLEMRRRLNRVLHTFGIAEGLQVVKKTNKIVTVRPGVAIDNLGREMIIEADQDVPLDAITTAVPAFITIAYAEQLTDPSTATGAPGDTRFTEAPILQAVTASPPTDGSVIRLALINLTAGGNVPGNVDDAFDGGVRQTAGPRGERGLASIDGVSNPGGDVDLVAGAGIAITPDQTNRRVTIAASGTQGLVSLDGVSNPGGNIDLVPVPGQSIVITPDDTNNQIMIGENHSIQTGNVHGLTAANLQRIGALLAVDYDLRQRGLGTTQFTAADLSGTTRTVNVGFIPRLVLVIGNAQANLSGRTYGGAVTAFQDFENNFVRCSGFGVTRVSNTDWFCRVFDFAGLYQGVFFNQEIVPNQGEVLTVSVRSVSAIGLTLQLTRIVLAGAAGAALPNFTITLNLFIMG